MQENGEPALEMGSAPCLFLHMLIGYFFPGSASSSVWTIRQQSSTYDLSRAPIKRPALEFLRRSPLDASKPLFSRP